jgi:hypothetical protein
MNKLKRDIALLSLIGTLLREIELKDCNRHCDKLRLRARKALRKLYKQVGKAEYDSVVALVQDVWNEAVKEFDGKAIEIVASIIGIWDDRLVKYGLTNKLMEDFSYYLNIIELTAEVEINSYELGEWFKTKIYDKYS